MLECWNEMLGSLINSPVGNEYEETFLISPKYKKPPIPTVAERSGISSPFHVNGESLVWADRGIWIRRDWTATHAPATYGTHLASKGEKVGKLITANSRITLSKRSISYSKGSSIFIFYFYKIVSLAAKSSSPLLIPFLPASRGSP